MKKEFVYYNLNKDFIKLSQNKTCQPTEEQRYHILTVFFNLQLTQD